jgi:hypothetical protein
MPTMAEPRKYLGSQQHGIRVYDYDHPGRQTESNE